MSLVKVRVEPVLTNVTLESTEAATQADASRKIIDASNETKVWVAVTYTTGAGETNNTCTVRVYGWDGQNWQRIGVHDVAAGVATFTATDFNVVGAAAATTYTWSFIAETLYTQLKVTALETGVATNKGTVTVSLTLA